MNSPLVSPDLPMTSGFDIKDAEFSFLPGFPPVRGGTGSGRLGTDSLKIGLDSGFLEESGAGRADISGTGLEIATLSYPYPIVNLTVKSTSSVNFLVHFLERPEIRVRLPEFIDTDAVSGTAGVSGSFRFPMRPQQGMRDVEYSITARLADVRARALRIPGLRETADLESGELVVHSSNAGISVSGPVSAGGLQGELAWNKKSDSSQPRSNVLTVNLDMSPEDLDLFGAEFLKGYLSGTTRLKIEADFDSPEGRVVTATSSLDGMTLTFPELNWSRNGFRKGPAYRGQEPGTSRNNRTSSDSRQRDCVLTPFSGAAIAKTAFDLRISNSAHGWRRMSPYGAVRKGFRESN